LGRGGKKGFSIHEKGRKVGQIRFTKKRALEKRKESKNEVSFQADTIFGGSKKKKGRIPLCSETHGGRQQVARKPVLPKRGNNPTSRGDAGKDDHYEKKGRKREHNHQQSRVPVGREKKTRTEGRATILGAKGSTNW